MQKIGYLATSLIFCVILSTGCSTAAVGVGALGAVAETVAGKSYATESRRRAEMQSQMQEQEDSQHPQSFETEAAYLQVVEQMQRQGLWFASLAHIDALEARWPRSAHSKLLRADALRHIGEKQSADVLYQQLAQGPMAARAWHGRGLLAASDGQFDRAVSHFQVAQMLTPTDALLLSDLGYALLHTGQALQAGLPLKQAAQLMPQHARIQSNLALFLVLYGQDQEALAWMNQQQMAQAQRLKVFEEAQRISSSAPVPMAPQSVSDVQPSGLIFENRIGVVSPANL